MFNLMVAGMMGSVTSPVTGSNTAALLHFDGTNGSTTFTDETAKQTWSVSAGSPTISTAQKKFGTASLYAYPISSAIIAGSSVNCGAGDFTLESFLRKPSGLDFYFWTASNPMVFQAAWFNSEQRFRFYTNPGGNYVYGNASGLFNDGNWHHVAFVKSSGVGTWYFDGTALSASRYGTIDTPNTRISLGDNGNNQAQYYIDEFRASSIARYTGNFTPTASAFTVD